LLRFRDGACNVSETAAIQRHIEVCATCSADLESMRFFDLDMLALEEDREALRTFRPDAEHAYRCDEMTDERLLETARASMPPEDLKLREHLLQCPFCRLRMAIVEETRDGEPTLKGRILHAVLDDSIADAARAVHAARLWAVHGQVRRFTKAVGAWVNDTGEMVAAGLEKFMLPERQLQAVQLSAKSERLAPSTRSIPVEGRDWEMVFGMQPEPGSKDWTVFYSFSTTEDAGLPISARVEVHAADGEIVFSGRAAEHQGSPITLEHGEYEMRLLIDNETWCIPFAAGQPPEVNSQA